ncbi:DUF3265 domain-containing protein [Vibrio vulnificus]|nr:DUF3265 domain-containing protein [Vibrio vulnificus]
MHAAWHFGYAVSFGGESGLREVGLCGIHPLTQRYIFRRYSDITKQSSKLRVWGDSISGNSRFIFSAGQNYG